MPKIWNKNNNALYTPNMLLLILIVSISFLGLGFVLPLRALYGREAGASSIEIGFMGSSFLLAAVISAPFIGWLADRIGCRRVLWIGLLAHMVLIFAYVVVHDPITLIGLRALEGMTSAAVLPPARALVNVIAPKTRQSEGLGLISAALSIGILLGPVAGALLANAVGFEYAFIVAGITLGLSALSCIFLPNATTIQATQQLTASVKQVHIRDTFTRPLILSYVLQCILMASQGAMPSIWGIYMQDRGATLPEIGFSFATFALPQIIMTPLAGRIADRYGRFWPIVLGFLMTGITFVLYALPVSIFWLLVITALDGISAAIVRSGIDGLLADASIEEAKGRIQANFSAAGTLGSFSSASLSGFLYQVSPESPFYISGFLCIIIAGTLLLPMVTRLFPSKSFTIQPDLTHTDTREQPI